MATKAGAKKKSSTKGSGAITKRRKGQTDKSGIDVDVIANSKELVGEKLTKLTIPILEKYGFLAFEEVITRLEITIKEFNEEVGSLFGEMVNHSRENYGRLKLLLDQDAEPEEPTDDESVDDFGMSELERRLETVEREGKSSEDKDTESPSLDQ